MSLKQIEEHAETTGQRIRQSAGLKNSLVHISYESDENSSLGKMKETKVDSYTNKGNYISIGKFSSLQQCSRKDSELLELLSVKS